jgi:hypothetical protein
MWLQWRLPQGLRHHRPRQACVDLAQVAAERNDAEFGQ